MSSNTPAETVWYRNTEQDTLHEVEKGSPLEKRLRKEQREVLALDEDGNPTGESDFESAYEKVSDSELKKLQAKPESLPGYPVAQEQAKADAKAKADAEASKQALIDQAIAGGQNPDPGKS